MCRGFRFLARAVTRLVESFGPLKSSFQVGCARRTKIRIVACDSGLEGLPLHFKGGGLGTDRFQSPRQFRQLAPQLVHNS
jgi:hypothetical protein